MADHAALDLRLPSGHETSGVGARLYAALDDLEPVAIQEQDDDRWRVFFHSIAARDAASTALSTLLADTLIALAPLMVPDEDWARRSQANLTAVTVGRITVAPPWDIQSGGSGISATETPAPGSSEPDPGRERIEIVIDPSMGFGTGHHQTTRLCLALLQTAAVAGRRVIDVGTGSGVLAIAAWRLGASSVVAMDNDPDAMQNARENIARNGADRHIEVALSDLRDFAAAPADIVTANLTAAALRHHAGALLRLLRPGGSLIVSGFGPSELEAVIEAFGAVAVQPMVEGDWTATLIQP